MESLSYNIGGLPFQVSGTQSLRWLKQSEAFKAFETKENAPCSHFIELDNPADAEGNLPVQQTLLTADASTPIHTFPLQDGTRCFWKKSGNRYQFEMNTTQKAMLFSFENDRCAYATAMHSPFHLMFGLWMAFNYFAAPLQIVCLHSSCISLQGKSILFLGASGSGKSTQSRLWQQCFPETELLNDDGPVLSAVEGQFHAFGSPWSGKTACYKQAHYPVVAFVKVEQSSQNNISPLPAAAAVATLMASFPPTLCREQAFADRYLDIISGLLQQATVYRLACRPDEAAALLCHRTIFETP